MHFLTEDLRSQFHINGGIIVIMSTYTNMENVFLPNPKRLKYLDINQFIALHYILKYFKSYFLQIFFIRFDGLSKIIDIILNA